MQEGNQEVTSYVFLVTTADSPPSVSCHFPVCFLHTELQSTLVISKSKRLSDILRDIRTSTYQILKIEEKIIQTTTFNKFI